MTRPEHWLRGPVEGRARTLTASRARSSAGRGGRARDSERFSGGTIVGSPGRRCVGRVSSSTHFRCRGPSLHLCARRSLVRGTTGALSTEGAPRNGESSSSSAGQYRRRRRPRARRAEIDAGRDDRGTPRCGAAAVAVERPWSAVSRCRTHPTPRRADAGHRPAHFMYETRRHKLAPWETFIRRAYRHVIWAAVVVLCAVGVGTLGYHGIGRLPWVDAFLNASMILSGMGPVDRMDHRGEAVFRRLRLVQRAGLHRGLWSAVLAVAPPGHPLGASRRSITEAPWSIVMETSLEWRVDHAQNAKALLEIPWDQGGDLTPDECHAIARSLKEFQAGESSEGKHLVHMPRSTRSEQEIGNMSRRSDCSFQKSSVTPRDLRAIPRVQRHSTGRVLLSPIRIPAVPRVLIGTLEISIGVLITAEMIAKVYYAALHEATGSKVLRTLCEQFCVTSCGTCSFRPAS